MRQQQRRGRAGRRLRRVIGRRFDERWRLRARRPEELRLPRFDDAGRAVVQRRGHWLWALHGMSERWQLGILLGFILRFRLFVRLVVGIVFRLEQRLFVGLVDGRRR